MNHEPTGTGAQRTAAAQLRPVDAAKAPQLPSNLLRERSKSRAQILVLSFGIVVSRCDASQVCWNTKVRCAFGNNEEGSLVAKLPDEQPKFEDYVVTSRHVLLLPQPNSIGRRKNKDPKI